MLSINPVFRQVSPTEHWLWELVSLIYKKNEKISLFLLLNYYKATFLFSHENTFITGMQNIILKQFIPSARLKYRVKNSLIILNLLFQENFYDY